jgi:4-amino-4-deoxy-L-arabinose transferase-like glycosyltransferase
MKMSRAENTTLTSPRKWRLALIVLCAAALAWGSFVVVTGETRPASDQREYFSAAMRFAKGFGLTHPGGELYVHTHPPLYALFLGVIYRAGGGNTAAKLVQLVLALATLVLAFLTARAAFGDRAARATLVAGAAYLPTAFYVTQLLSEVLFTFFLVAAAYVLYAAIKDGRAGVARCAAAGILLGLAALTRGVALAVAAGWALYVLLRRGPPVGRRVAAAAALAAATLAAVAPWSAYVYSKTGRFVLLDTKSSAVFYYGNGPNTPSHHAWDITHAGSRFVPPPGVAATADRFEHAREYRAAALDYVKAHPVRTLVRFGSKAADLWEPERLFVGAYRTGYLPNARRPLVLGYIAAEFAASATALLLFWFAAPLVPASRWRGLALIAVLSTTLAYAATVAHPRYNYPLMVLGLPAIGYFFAEALPRLRAGAYSRRRLALGGAAAAVLMLIWARMIWLFLTRGS